jgi:hypothetical protein
MIQKYINFVVFKVDSTWTEWSPSGLQLECVGECKVHQDSTWETAVVVLLQSTSNTTPLSTTIISMKLMQEYHCITGGEQADSALTALQAKSSSLKVKAKSSKQCHYCKFAAI